MKKLLSVDQIRNWDAATIAHEPIASIDLMERAALSCTTWLVQNGFAHRRFTIVCGIGNNGGDGLAIARQLITAGCAVDAVVLAGDEHRGSRDFTINLQRLRELEPALNWHTQSSDFPKSDVCIDALFGTGLDRPIAGSLRQLVESINAYANTVISIDVPSGLPGIPGAFRVEGMVDANAILNFQQYKEALFHPDSMAGCRRAGKVHVLDIGLWDGFLDTVETRTFTFDRTDAAERIIDRHRFSHKGSFGAAFIAAGSEAMPGAAVLSVKAALRSGCGLVFAQVPAKAKTVVNIAAPEAMTHADAHLTVLSQPSIPEKTTAIACGPGIGIGEHQDAFLLALLTDRRPTVLDADALNAAAVHPSILEAIKKHRNCILTPHPAEFDRLFGAHETLKQRIDTASTKAAELNAVIHIKGAYSVTVLPSGHAVYNTCGSAAMAVGGSGDVLTGLVVGLLAAGYEREIAMLLGAALHGTAGECYEKEYGRMGLTAGALVDFIPQAWKTLRSLA